jgi:hypothetical protein
MAGEADLETGIGAPPVVEAQYSKDVNRMSLDCGQKLSTRLKLAIN